MTANKATRSTATAAVSNTTPGDPSSWPLGYCTNIHPGVDADAIVGHLGTIAADVRRRFQTDRQNATTPASGDDPASTALSKRRRDTAAVAPLHIGLWLPWQATRELRRNGTAPLIEGLKKNHLVAYTINGFPYDNFHQDRVKHDVYQPTWWQDERVGYTRDLAKILSELLPADVTTGTISTLPLGWPTGPHGPGGGKASVAEADDESTADIDDLHHAGTNLRRLAEDLRMLEDRSGKRIVCAIEPEPGCLLQTSTDVVQWFDAQLPDPTHRRYIGVCHDVCHAAVMMESQLDVLKRYAAAGIQVAKLQISSAIVTDWSTIPAGDRDAALTQLTGFAEDRYLHQTGRVDHKGAFTLHEDLPDLLALAAADPSITQTDQRWITHFHVPVFLESIGWLSTTRADVLEALSAIVELTRSKAGRKALQFTGHLEVETYAWSVMPPSARRDDLAGDIAQELGWVADRVRDLATAESLS